MSSETDRQVDVCPECGTPDLRFTNAHARDRPNYRCNAAGHEFDEPVTEVTEDYSLSGIPRLLQDEGVEAAAKAIAADGGERADPSKLMECPGCGSHSALRRGVEDCPHCGTSCVRARADGGQCDAAVACLGCGERVERRSTDHYCETEGCEYVGRALDASEYRVTTIEKLGDPEAVRQRGRAQDEG